MPVSAKFKVARVIPSDWATEVEMTPDYAQGRNKEWSEATPSGTIRLTITNKAAIDQFPQGSAQTVTFEKTED
jgi:hypothetical protein